jgi:chemotaxis protein methyltransferase CheR
VITPPSIQPLTAMNATLKMSDDVFQRLRAFIYERTGIYFQDNKKYLLEGRLGKRLQFLHLDDYDNYIQLLKYGATRNDELRFFYDAITINETFMFRNEPQFDALEKTIASELMNLKRTSPRPKLRIWSSAASSGEEAYTLVMIYLEKLKPRFPTLELEVIGTDINHSVIETARKGIYREYSIRNTPKSYLQKYFDTDGVRYQVKDELRKYVRFENVNLHDQAGMKRMGVFDIIFCCNVLIYFDTKSKARVIANLYDSLQRSGYLFIGYAESLHGLSTAFKLVSFPKTVAYKKE